MASSKLTAVRAQWTQRRSSADRDIGARDRIRLQLQQAQARLLHLAEEDEVLTLTQALALALEGEWRKTFESSLEEVVSDGLTLVMGETLYLRLKSSIKNGASAVEFRIDSPRGDTPIMGYTGGSVVQITSFLVRLMVLLAHRPELRHVITLDEAFGGMSEENVPHTANLLRQLVDDTGVQVIFVTQDRQYADVADIVIDVASVGKVTVLKTKRDEV